MSFVWVLSKEWCMLCTPVKLCFGVCGHGGAEEDINAVVSPVATAAPIAVGI